MLDLLMIAQTEHRQFERDFAVRAARGEFIKHPELARGSQPGFRQLGHLIRAALAAVWLAAR